jgi:hypothetical protein
MRRSISTGGLGTLRQIVHLRHVHVQPRGRPSAQPAWRDERPVPSWSARRVLIHSIAETAQHAGHADIIREALDGAKSMG